MISQEFTKDARITQVTSAPQITTLSEIESSSQLQILEDSFDDSLSSFHEFVKPQNNIPSDKNYTAISQSVTPLRGVNNIHATSCDGMAIFTGLDELVIYIEDRRLRPPTCSSNDDHGASSSAAADANATSHATVGTYPFVVQSPTMGATTTRVYPGSLSPKREKDKQTRELTVFNGLLK
jgi:hypothetical protein